MTHIDIESVMVHFSFDPFIFFSKSHVFELFMTMGERREMGWDFYFQYFWEVLVNLIVVDLDHVML